MTPRLCFSFNMRKNNPHEKKLFFNTRTRRRCPARPTFGNFAAHFGQLEALKYAREHGAPWESFTCALAARGGHLHVLQWLRADGCRLLERCPWDGRTCQFAAMNGHLHVLQWAYENGCAW